MTTEHVIVCSPPNETNWTVPGTRVDACHNCAAPIGVAPSSYKIVADKGAALLCNDCGFKRMKGVEAAELHLMEAQYEELRQGGIEDPEAFVRQLNQHARRKRS